MKEETKTPFRAEAWAKNPMLTSTLLSGNEGNKRRLSEEHNERNKKATSLPLGQSLLSSKTSCGLGGISRKTTDFSSMTANRLLYNQSNSMVRTSNTEMMSNVATNKLLTEGLSPRSSLLTFSLKSNKLATSSPIKAMTHSIRGIDPMPRMENQLSVTEKGSSAKVPRIEVSAKSEDIEMDDMEPDPTFPSYPSLTDNVVIKSTATSPVVHEVDHLTGEKERLLQFVSLSASGLATELKQTESAAREALTRAVFSIAEQDPEFILKAALYCRQELGLRLAANLLLALASLHPATARHLVKYFGSTVRIPSDWLAVASLCNSQESSLKPGSLPAALRRVMKTKFSQFDEYQLAKHNKSVGAAPSAEGLDEEEWQAVLRARDYTIKRLVRLLHLSEPTHLVMAILGKKYPLNKEEWRAARLPGQFDPKRAGKRMALSVPETWETQVALHGNKASVWEGLVEKKKLPYLAGVRNLRNIILAGTSEATIRKIASYISNETAVTRARMFPFQYFTAFDVLKDMREMKEGRKDKQKPSKPEEKKERWMVVKEEKQAELAKNLNTGHLDLLKKALDTAVNISARKNVPPLPGTTIVLCAYGLGLTGKFSQGKGLSQRGATVRDSALLFSLMVNQAAESGRLVLYSSKELDVTKKLPGKDLLSNVEWVKNDAEVNKKIGAFSNRERGDVALLQKLIKEEEWVDNIIIFHGGEEEDQTDDMKTLVKTLRQRTNPNLLYARVNICARPDLSQLAGGLTPEKDTEEDKEEENNIEISGFSESVLQLLVARGSGGQLDRVESIDRRLGLPPTPKNLCPSSPTIIEAASDTDQQWKTLRIFVSSTFLDMQAERSLLHHFVLPQVRRMARELCVEVELVDLRWGLLGEGAAQVEQCLAMARESDIFLGFLGERYGWVPTPEEGGNGSSITEMEMMEGALGRVTEMKDRAFFYLRNSNLFRTLPWSVQNNFSTPDEDGQEKIKVLKTKILTSGLEVMSNYPAKWEGAGAKGMVGGLQELGERVVTQVWGAVQRAAPQRRDGAGLEQERRRQEAHLDKEAKGWVGREEVVNAGTNAVEKGQGIVLITGPPGAGTSALLARLGYGQTRRPTNKVISFLMDAALRPNVSLHYVLTYLLHCLGGGKTSSTEDTACLGARFRQVLGLHSATGTKLVILLDDIQTLKDWEVSWIPALLPEGVVLVLRASTGTKLHNMLRSRPDAKEVVVKPLEMRERTQLAKAMLSKQGKELSETAWSPLLQQLVSRRGASSPAYIELALSKLAREGTHEGLGKAVHAMSSTTANILVDLLQEAEMACGASLVSQVLLFCLLSPSGLSRPQLHSLLVLQDRLHSAAGAERRGVDALSDMLQEQPLTPVLPLGQLCICLERLSDFLTQSGSRLQVVSGQAQAVLEERFLKPLLPAEVARVHRMLAAVALAQYKQGFTDPATLIALPAHLGAAGDVALLKSILCSANFLQAKVKAGQSNLFFSDLDGISLKIRSVREKFCKDPLVAEYRDFVSANMVHLVASPSSVPQLLLNQPKDSLMRAAFVDQAWKGGPLMQWCSGPSSMKEAARESVVVKEDKGNPASCLAASRLLLATGFMDGSIMVAELEKRRDLFSLVGHSDTVVGLGFLGEEVLVSGARDGWICSWDLETKTRLNCVRASEGRLSGIAVRHPLVLTSSWDGNLRVWSRKLEAKSKLPTNGTPINCCLLHPSKDMAVSGGWDSTVRVWDLVSLKQRAVLRGHQASVQAIALTEDERKIISGSLDGTVKIWDCSNGTEISSYCTGSRLSYLALGPGDEEVVVGGLSGILTAWPLSPGRQEARASQASLSVSVAPGFVPRAEPTGDKTGLGRKVSKAAVMGSDLWLGLETGEVMVGSTSLSDCRAGWKVMEEAITLLGGQQGYSLAGTEAHAAEAADMISCAQLFADSDDEGFGFNWADDDSSSSSSSDDSYKVPALPHVSRSQQTTMWVGGGHRLLLASFSGDMIIHTVELTGLRAGATELLIHKQDAEEVLVVLGRCGGIYVYAGHPARLLGEREEASPIFICQAHNGGVTAGVTFENNLLTVGEDRRLKCWRLHVANSEVFLEQQELETSLFTSKPIGVVLLKSREKVWLWLGMEDGTLVRHEVLGGTDSLTLGPQLEVTTCRQGLVRVSSAGNTLLAEHNGGQVSLWSVKGSEVGSWSRQSTAAVIWGESDELRLVLGGSRGLEKLIPGAAACSRVLGGHNGPVTGLLAVPGALFSSCRDGRVRLWPWGPEDGDSPQQVEEVVGIEDVSTGSQSLQNFLVVGSKGTLTRWSWEGDNAVQEDSVGAHLLERRLDETPIRVYGRTSSSSFPAAVSASLVDPTHQGSNVILVTASKSSCPTVSVFLVDCKENCRLEVEFVGQAHTNLTGRPVHLSLKSSGQHEQFTIHVTDENEQKEVMEVNLAHAKTIQRQRLFQMVHCSRYGLSDPQHRDSLPQLLEPIAERKYRLRGGAPATLVLGQNGEVEVEREGEERQMLRLHQGARISTLAALQSTDKENCFLASGAEDGLVKIWRVSSNGWSQIGMFQCKGPAVTKVVGCEGWQEVTAEEGQRGTVGRVVVADAAGAIYCIKGWP